MAAEVAAPFTPKPVAALEHDSQLWQARFSPCGKFLVASAYDASIERWRIAGDEMQKSEPLLGHHGWVQAIEFHPREPLLFSGDSWGALCCWRYDDNPQLVWSVPDAHPGWIRGVAVGPGGEWVASCGNDAIVRVRSAADGKPHQEFAGHAAAVFSVCFHPDGTSLVSGDLKGIIRHWDLPTGKLIRELNASSLYQRDKIQDCGGARHLAFNAAGNMLVCAGQKTPTGGFATGLPAVLLFDWTSGVQLREMQIGGTEDGFVYDARFHPQGFVMAASCAFPGKGHLWFWRPGEEKPFFTSTDLPNGRTLSLHPDGRLAMLVSLSANGNGRSLKDGQYQDGTSKIQILKLEPG